MSKQPFFSNQMNNPSTGSVRATNKIVPQLQFPEFVDEGEWEEKMLGEVAFFVSEKTSLKNITTNSYISTENLLSDYDGVTSASKLPSSGNFTKYKKGDVLISNIRPYLKKVWFSDKDGACSNDVFVVRANSEISELFLSFLLKNDHFINYIMIGAKGVKMPRGDKGLMEKYPIYFSENKTEQQKIASCLSSLDELIAAESQKLEALTVHKKGLMQNLFPQEGDASTGSARLPKLRFSEFADDGDWEEKKLGEVADFINGRAYKQEELLSKGKYRVLRVGNFFTNNEWYYSNFELDEDKYCDKGDLLYAWSASFGPHLWNEERVIYHYHIWKVKNKQGVNRIFLFYLLDYETIRMKAKSLNGFALMHITKGTIEEWKSIVPKSEKEQQKIASCLSSLDALIKSQGEKIAALKLHKKGLMQGLFPQNNE